MPNLYEEVLNLIMTEEQSKRRSFSPCFSKPLLKTKNFRRKIGSVFSQSESILLITHLSQRKLPLLPTPQPGQTWE